MNEEGTVFYGVMSYIERSLWDGFSMDQLSRETFTSKSTLMRKFKQETGITINKEYNIQKILHSLKPLIETNDTLLKIALNSGFNSLEYYSETFKKYFGFSPLQFRKFMKCGTEEDLYLGKTLIQQLSLNKEKYEVLKNQEQKIYRKH